MTTKRTRQHGPTVLLLTVGALWCQSYGPAPNALLASAVSVLEECEKPATSDFSRYTRFYCPEDTEVQGQALQFDHPENIPAWLSGKYVVSSLAQQSVGSMETRNYFDGFMKTTVVSLTGSVPEATLSTKMMNTNRYEESQQKGEIAAGISFDEMQPQRRSDRIAGLNTVACSKGGCDNNFVTTAALPDGRIVASSDTSTFIVLDLENVSSTGIPAFVDDEVQPAVPGPSHSLEDPVTHDFISGFIQSPEMIKFSFYRINHTEPSYRHVFASATVTPGLYVHSFGLTEDYAILADHSIRISTADVLEGKALKEAFVMNQNKDMTFKLASLRTGEVVSVPTANPFIILHFANAYSKVLDDGTFVQVMDVEGYDATSNPFLSFEFDSIFNESYVFSPGSTYRRFTINLNTSSVVSDDLLSVPHGTPGSYGFPRINPAFQSQSYCYSYVSHLFSNTVEGWSVVKYDHCADKVAGEFQQPGMFFSEFIVVDNPESEVEDDAVLVGFGFNAPAQTSQFIVVDASTMETLAVANVGFIVPFPIHGSFYSEE